MLEVGVDVLLVGWDWVWFVWIFALGFGFLCWGRLFVFVLDLSGFGFGGGVILFVFCLVLGCVGVLQLSFIEVFITRLFGLRFVVFVGGLLIGWFGW